MKKRSLEILILLSAALLVLSAIFVPRLMARRGSLKVNEINFLDSTGAECNRDYDIKRLLVRAERNGRGTTEEVECLPLMIGDLETGKWLIKVDAFDSRGAWITSESVEVEIAGDKVAVLDMEMPLPGSELNVPNGKMVKLEAFSPFALSAVMRPMRTSAEYRYTWTFWSDDLNDGIAHSVDMRGEERLESDAFWDIYEFYEGKAHEFSYTVDVTENGARSSFSGHISVI